jgi:hypothetical protein
MIEERDPGVVVVGGDSGDSQAQAKGAGAA